MKEKQGIKKNEDDDGWKCGTTPYVARRNEHPTPSQNRARIRLDSETMCCVCMSFCKRVKLH
jgi:hypothetical protein